MTVLSATPPAPKRRFRRSLFLASHPTHEKHQRVERTMKAAAGFLGKGIATAFNREKAMCAAIVLTMLAIMMVAALLFWFWAMRFHITHPDEWGRM